MSQAQILKRKVELQATAMYARGENPTCWRIAAALGLEDITFTYIEPLLKFWREEHSDPQQRNQVVWRSGSRTQMLRKLRSEDL